MADEFSDLSLSARARDLALWLCDLANPAMPAPLKAASAELLLREVPDYWTAGDLEREACDIRHRIGPKASRRDWLSAMGWLVGEEERLPQGMPPPRGEAARLRVQRVLADALKAMGATPTPTEKPGPSPEGEAFVRRVMDAVQRQHPGRYDEWENE